VIGIVGSDAEIAYISANSFDGAINYRHQDVHGAVKSLCPDGVQFYSTMSRDRCSMPYCEHGHSVGGGMRIDDPVRKRRGGSRSLQIRSGPDERLRIEGFFSPDFYHREPDSID